MKWMAVGIGAVAALGIAGWYFTTCACGPEPPDATAANETRIKLSTVASALKKYKHDTGSFPTTAQGLAALRTQPDGVDHWNGPYFEYQLVLDGWGHDLVYKFPANSASTAPEVMSYGSDGKPGGSGDAADIVGEKVE